MRYTASNDKIMRHTYATQKADGGFTKRQLIANARHAVRVNERNNEKANRINTGKHKARLLFRQTIDRKTTAFVRAACGDDKVVIHSDLITSTMKRHPMRRAIRQEREFTKPQNSHRWSR